MADGVITQTEQTYLNTLATTQNNEYLAFLNGTLQDALNQVSGYRLQATIFGAMNPQSGLPSGVAPFPGGVVTTTGSSGGPWWSRPQTPSPSPQSGAPTSGGTMNVVLSGGTIDVVGLDGATIGKAVLKNLKGVAQRQFGDSTRWNAVQ